MRSVPLGTEHITLTGRYRIALPELLRDRGAYRDLNTAAAIAASLGFPHQLSIDADA